MQSGRTIGKNNFQLGVNGSYGKFSQNSVLNKDGDFDYSPVMGINGNYGLKENIDLGISIDITSFVGANVKYQFLGNKKSLFASSVGLEGGINFGALLFGNFTQFVTLPLYISCHPTNNFAFYLTPRYLFTSEYLFSRPPGSQKDQSTNISNFGNTVGLMFGNKNKVAFEVSSFEKDLLTISQFSVGYIYTFESNNKK